MRRTKNPELLEGRRRKAISFLQSGMSQSKAAMIVNVSRQSVSRWVKAFRRGGVDGLKRRPKSGRPPTLTEEQKKELISFLGTMAGHSKGRPMTSTGIAKLIRDQFGIEFHNHHIPRLLRSLKKSLYRLEDQEESTQK
jgi:transposase